MDTVRCRYSHCKHSERELNKADAVRCGNTYYHADCYHEKETIDKILDTYVKLVDPHPVFGALRKIVSNLIYKQGVNADFILFALKRAAQEHRINHPPGLYYVVKDQKTIEAWNRMLAEIQKPKVEFKVDADYTESTPIGYQRTKKTGFRRILA